MLSVANNPTKRPFDHTPTCVRHKKTPSGRQGALFI